MDKDFEIAAINNLLKTLDGYSLVETKRESPDFVLFNEALQKYIGVEVTEYFPHRDCKGRALVLRRGKNLFETDMIKHQFFQRFSLGWIRISPKPDYSDIIFNRVCVKERKLSLYKRNVPYCSEFWLLIVLNQFDDIAFDQYNQPSFQSQFNSIFILDYPDGIYELNTVLK